MTKIKCKAYKGELLEIINALKKENYKVSLEDSDLNTINEEKIAYITIYEDNHALLNSKRQMIYMFYEWFAQDCEMDFAFEY